MRHSFSQLIQTSKDYCVDDNATQYSGLSDTTTFIKREINNTVSDMFNLTRNWLIQPLPLTASTVAAQQYYHLPPMAGSVESVTVTIGSRTVPLVPITSQAKWDELNQIPLASSSYPVYFFPRMYDIGIYPIPSDVYTMTMVINPVHYEMTNLDYTTGTVAVTQGGTAVTGTDTTFTADMVGRWIYFSDTKIWQRVASYTSATVIGLETNYLGTSMTASSFILCESPEIADSLHHFIPYRVAAVYTATIRRSPAKAQKLMNFYYTGDFENFSRTNNIHGGLLGELQRHKTYGRANTQIVDTGITHPNWFDQERWVTTLTE